MKIHKPFYLAVMSSLCFIASQSQSFVSINPAIPDLKSSNTFCADFNNDDNIDILISGRSAINSVYLDLYLGSGTLDFVKINANLPALHNTDFCVYDFNNDMFLDVLISGISGLGNPLCRLYYNNQNNTFVPAPFSFDNLNNPSIEIADFNLDGRVDIIQTGMTEENEKVTFIYKNEVDSFIRISTNLPGIIEGSMKTFDINRDGRTDLIFSGISDFGKITSLFLNLGDFNFQEHPINLPATTNGSLCLTDFDIDNDFDIIISGYDADQMYINKIYENDGFLNFSETHSTLPGVRYSSVACGDINNDGYEDLGFIGQQTSGIAYSAICLNNKDGTYSVLSDEMKGSRDGSIEFMDYDNDGDIDILYTGLGNTGPLTELLENQDLTKLNSKPVIPSGLSTILRKDQLLFQWDKADDQITPSELLKYHIALGTESYNYNIIPLRPDIGGSKLIQDIPLSSFDTTVSLHLPEGSYFWKVKSVDNGFKTSEYSTEDTVQVCYSFDLGKDTSACNGDTLQFVSPKTGSSYHWVCNGDILSTSNQLQLICKGSTELVLTVESGMGCIRSDTILINMDEPPPLSLGPDTSICPGDTLRMQNRIDPLMKLDWYQLDGVPLLRDSNVLEYSSINDSGIVAVHTDPVTGCVNLDTMYIEVIKTDQPMLISDTTVCMQSNLQLSIGEKFQQPVWTYYQGINKHQPQLEYTTVGNDTIYLEAISPQGCDVYSSIAVRALPLPEYPVQTDTSLCEGTTLHIPFHIKQSGDSCLWSSLNNLSLNVDRGNLHYIVMQGDTLVRSITTSFGCKTIDTLFVKCNRLPEFQLTPTTGFCESEPVTISANFIDNCETISWFNNGWNEISTDTTFIYHPLGNETLIAVINSAQNCQAIDTVVLNMVPYFSIFQVQDTTVCPDINIQIPYQPNHHISTLTFSMNSDFNINWSKNNLETKVIEMDTVFSEYLTTANCSFHDTLYLSVYDQPFIELGNPRQACIGDSLRVQPDSCTVPSNLSWISPSGSISYSDFVIVDSHSDTLLICELEDENGCKSADTLALGFYALPNVKLPDTSTFCLGDTIRFHLPYDTICWNYNGNLYTSQSFIQPFTGESVLTVNVKDSMHCGVVKKIQLRSYPQPVISMSTDTTVCKNQAFRLAYPSKTDETYTWFNRHGVQVGNNTLQTVHAPETFLLQVTNRNGCTSSDTVSVDVFEDVALTLDTSIYICENEQAWMASYVHGQNEKQGWGYHWLPSRLFKQPNELNALMVPQHNTRIALLADNGICHADTFFANVYIVPNPSVEMCSDTAIGKGEQVQLDARLDEQCEINWMPATYLSSAMSASPVAYPPVTTTFYMHATNIFNCSTKDSITVFIYNDVFIPNLFSPNGDGNNDKFKVYGAGLGQLELGIYTFSGEQVWASNAINEICGMGWDGYHKGVPLPQGTYIWKLNGRFADGSLVTFQGKDSGTVQLIR